MAVASDLERISESYLELVTHRNSDHFERELAMLDAGELSNALNMLVAGKPNQQTVAREWFLAERLPVATLRVAGINRAIQTPDESVGLIAGMGLIFGRANELRLHGPGRLIWIIDEFQRIRDCTVQGRVEITTALHSLINTSPNYLTVFLSFSGRPERKLPDWLSPELTDRLGIERVLVLPPLRSDEAKTFVADLLREYRPPDYHHDAYFPFTEDAVDGLIETVRTRSELKPRGWAPALHRAD